MTSTKTADEWESKFGPSLENSEGSTFFESYGEDFEAVIAADPKTIWTIVESDKGHYLLPGVHTLNRIGYAITTRPFTGIDMETGLHTMSSGLPTRISSACRMPD